jgi:hypothetical protein
MDIECDIAHGMDIAIAGLIRDRQVIELDNWLVHFGG